MPDPAGPTATEDRVYAVSLTCPVCGTPGVQKALRARQVIALSVPGHPFHRGYTWTDGLGRLEDSPLYYGLCLCPECRYPALESEFRATPEETPAAHRSSFRRLFVEGKAGKDGPVGEVLGACPELLPQPERAVRISLAAIRAQTLPYPEFWRRPELAGLLLRLSRLYFDELHLSWEDFKPGQTPRYVGHSQRAAALRSILDALSTLRSSWSEIPLSLDEAQAQALRFQREIYESRAGELAPEETVHEERRLARLLGVNGQRELARDMYVRARATCARLRADALRRQQLPYEECPLSLGERRALTTLIQRLGAIHQEITDEGGTVFGSSCWGTIRTQDAARSRPARTPQPRKKRGFRFFG
jgi:hypothetical protein